ncbi:MAG: TonB family protein [Bacteroidota bacterium]
MKKYILFISMFFFTGTSFCQNIIYFNENWEVVKDKENANFYRKIFYLRSDSLYKIEDYYISDSIQMKGLFHDPQAEFEEGLVRWYYENGNVKTEAFYVFDEIKGLRRTYYSNGQVEELRNYLLENDSIDYEIKELFNKEGDTLVYNGNGQYIKYYDNSNIKIKGQLENGLKVGKWQSWRKNGELHYTEYYNANGQIDHGKSYDLESNEYSYEKLKVKVTYKGGDKKLFKKIYRNINYPREAYNAGIEGEIYVNLVINKNGRISESYILKGIGGGCDQEALRVIKKCKKWNPGLQRGQKIKTKVTLPIRFKL